ncbi:transposable element Tcb1 transposase [Trichonephila clavipes]|nr:transposable element Tcb1 transposase [Trichonephila clavipes]
MDLEKTSPSEIQELIKNLKPNKSPGIDLITNRILKNLPTKFIIFIALLFNMLLENCYFPKSWRMAVVISILKPNSDDFNHQNYHPISLLSSLSKAYEFMILNRLNQHCLARNIIIPEQHAFVTKCSTVTQLLKVTELVHTGFQNHQATVREIADILQNPKSTVSDVIGKWKRLVTETAEKRTGRLKILGERSCSTLKWVVKQNRKSSWVGIFQEFQSSSGISVSSRTVRGEINIWGFHGRAAAHQRNIPPQNAKPRLQWCRAPRHWTVGKLFFGGMNLALQSGSRRDASALPGERFFSDCIGPTVQLGGGSLMVWGCFSCFGLGPLVSVIGNINSEMYVDILDNAALPTLWQYFGEGPFLFQQDNCSIHTSRLAQKWLDEMGVQKLGWSSQSPDLNPIEHLWDELERRLRSQPNRPSSLQSLTSAVMDAWKAIPMVTPIKSWWKVFPNVCRLSSM